MSEQQAAVEAPGGAAVLAGAGCGKTTVLARRFVHLLRPRDDGTALVGEVGRILAITFTEKAAAEMKKRIRALVAAEMAAAPEGVLRAHWERVRRELLGAQISTIHAFCGRVLRDHPLEAGIDPHAAVLDEHESREYVERAVAEELTARLRAGDGAARALLVRCRTLHAGRRGGATRTVARLLDVLARMGRDGAWLAAATRRAADDPGLATSLHDARGALVAAVEQALPAPRPSKALRRLAAEWPEWRARLDRLERMTPDEFVGLRGLAVLFGKVAGSGLREHLAVDGDRLKGLVADAYGAYATAGESAVLAAAIAELGHAVAARKRADALLTFDDLVRGAQGLLERRPAVARRYAERFQAVLVDEFQDTDAVQADLIHRLAADPETALFVVGDEKQSIYRFRGADVTVFKGTAARIGAPYPLGLNFRSQPGVLAFVNVLAGAMFGAPAGAMEPAQWTAFDAADRLRPAREQTRRGPSVRLVTFAGEERLQAMSASQAREVEARVLAGVIAELRAREDDPVAYGDVAVLFRTLNQVKAYEYALARRGIPYYVVKGRGFFQSQEVRDVTNLLATIADRTDDLALAAALRSPFFGIDDGTLLRLAWPASAERPDLAGRFHAGRDEEDLDGGTVPVARARTLIKELRRLRSRCQIAELLGRALAATDLDAVYLTQPQGRQKVANVRKVIELAREFERRGTGGLVDFVRRLRRLDADEPREAEAMLASEGDQVVRLMTIHQAKGLEFPVVVLVDLARPLDSDTETLVVDPERGLLVAPLFGAGGHTLRHAGLEAYRRRERERSQAELARLFYVACTRAADELVLLEGRGKATDPHGWCSRVWDVVGRDAVQAVARRGDAMVVTPSEGVSVAIEPARRHLGVTGVPLVPRQPVEEPPDAPVQALVARVVDFVPPQPRETTTTPTALAAFRRCPRQYWYRHVIGLSQADALRGRAARLAGMLAHGVLERVDYGQRQSEAALYELAMTRPESLQLHPERVAAVARDLAAATALVDREIAAGLTILAREEPVVLGVPAGAPDVMLHGRIDVLARRAGVLVVQDYKYAEASPARRDAYAQQLVPYRLAVSRATGEPTGGEIVFLRGTPRIVRLPALDAPREEAALAEQGRALGAVVGRRDAAAFPRRPPEAAACRALGCEYVRRCWGAARLSDSARDDPSRAAGA